MPSKAGITDCRVPKCDRKTVPRCGTCNRKCSTAVCGQSVTWDHQCVLLSRPKTLPWHHSADWDDMVRQIVRCMAVQTPMNSDDQLEHDTVWPVLNYFIHLLQMALNILCYPFAACLTVWLYAVIESKARAAITIQSLWRGYHARQRNPDVVKVRHEMRWRRSEDHIKHLHQQLNK